MLDGPSCTNVTTRSILLRMFELKLRKFSASQAYCYQAMNTFNTFFPINGNQAGYFNNDSSGQYLESTNASPQYLGQSNQNPLKGTENGPHDEWQYSQQFERGQMSLQQTDLVLDENMINQAIEKRLYKKSGPTSSAEIHWGRLLEQFLAEKLHYNEQEGNYRNQDFTVEGKDVILKLLGNLSKNRDGVKISSPLKLTEANFQDVVRSVNQVIVGLLTRSKSKAGCVLGCFEDPFETSSNLSLRNDENMHFYITSALSVDAPYIPDGYEPFASESTTESEFKNLMYLLEISSSGENGVDPHLNDIHLAFPELDIDTANKIRDSLEIRILSASGFCKMMSINKTLESFISAIGNLDLYTMTSSMPIGRGCSPRSDSLIAVIFQKNPLYIARLGSNKCLEACGSLVAKFFCCRETPMLKCESAQSKQDPFSGSSIFRAFMIGRTFTVRDVAAVKECDGKLELSTRETMKLSMLSATRFVPLHKKRQWDEIPHLLLSVIPYQNVDPAFRHWLLHPFVRR